MCSKSVPWRGSLSRVLATCVLLGFLHSWTGGVLAVCWRPVFYNVFAAFGVEGVLAVCWRPVFYEVFCIFWQGGLSRVLATCVLQGYLVDGVLAVCWRPVFYNVFV